MPNTATADLDDYTTFDRLAEEFPAYPLATLKYLARAEVRKANGFAACLRRITPRRVLISRSAFAAWIEGQNEQQPA